MVKGGDLVEDKYMICCYLSMYMYIHVYIMSCIEVNIMLASVFFYHISKSKQKVTSTHMVHKISTNQHVIHPEISSIYIPTLIWIFEMYPNGKPMPYKHSKLDSSYPNPSRKPEGFRRECCHKALQMPKRTAIN